MINVKFDLLVEYVIAKKEIKDRTHEIVLYLNAHTPYEYEYYLNSYNTKTKSGGGSSYDRLDYAIEDFNKIGWTKA